MSLLACSSLAASFTEGYLNLILLRYGHHDQQKTKWKQIDAMLTYTRFKLVQSTVPNIFFLYDTYHLMSPCPVFPFF